jgi:hypothetical protein
MFLSSTAMRAAAKRPPYSASATNEQTTGMRVEWVEMGWLMGQIDSTLDYGDGWRWTIDLASITVYKKIVMKGQIDLTSVEKWSLSS